jgi:hypothetical protein
MLQPVKPCQAQRGGKGEAQQHGVEENEPRDGGVGVFKQYHQTDQPDSRPAEIHLPSRIVCKRNTHDPESRIEHAHEGVVDVFWIGLAGLELERPIVTGQVTGQTNQHLSQGRMNVEVELALQVMRAEFSKAERIVRRCHAD